MVPKINKNKNTRTQTCRRSPPVAYIRCVFLAEFIDGQRSRKMDSDDSLKLIERPSAGAEKVLFAKVLRQTAK